MTDKQSRRVLNVGQCGFDHGNIARLLRDHFAADVDRADTLDQAEQRLAAETYDLVLVNRIVDADGAEGLEFIHRLQERSESAPPVMLVSNLPDAQQAAVAAGAVPGFGKSELTAPATFERLQPYLARKQ